MRKNRKSSKEILLFDRMAVGFLSALLGAISYSLVWFLFARGAPESLLASELFFMFTGAMFLIGFFTLDKYSIGILSFIWKFLMRFGG